MAFSATGRYKVIGRPGGRGRQASEVKHYTVQGPQGRDDISIVPIDLFKNKVPLRRRAPDEKINVEAATAVAESEGLELKKEVEAMRKDKPRSPKPKRPTKPREQPYTLLAGLEDPTVRRPTLLRGRR